MSDREEKSIKQNGTRTLWQAFKALEEFRKLDPEIPTQTVNTFLYVASHEGCTMKDIADALGVAQSTMSRNIAALDKINRHHQPGFDLVRAVEDPSERRRKIVTLTPRGRQLKARLNEQLAAAQG
jgi:DNA-binding MarR family transcriptional regulator